MMKAKVSWKGLFLGTVLSLFSLTSGAALELTEVKDFGSNPGNLKMFKFLPSKLNSPRPLVVVMHGCTQNVAQYEHDSGWTKIAERGGFAIAYVEQKSENNATSCFNWFQESDARRGQGEMLSIHQMILKMIKDEGISKDHIFIAGFSSGAAFAAAALANYPDVFKGGAIFSGVPYGCANSLNEAFLCMNGMYKKEPKEWGKLVRDSFEYRGPRPTVAVWHGTGDTVIKPVVADELVEQWMDVLGTSEKPAKEVKTNNLTYKAWASPSGQIQVEYFLMQGIRHGHPIKPGTSKDSCGVESKYVLDSGICGAYVMSRSWGILGVND